MSASIANWWQVFICLRPKIPYPPPPVKHCMNTYPCTSFTQGRGEGRVSENVRGALVHKEGSKIPTWLGVSPIYKLKTPVKTTFKVWCLYSYLVHGQTLCCLPPDRRTWKQAKSARCFYHNNDVSRSFQMSSLAVPHICWKCFSSWARRSLLSACRGKVARARCTST